MPVPEPLSAAVYHPSLEQWFDSSFVRILSTSESLGWNNILARSTELQPVADYSATPQTSDDNLVIVMEGSTRIESRQAGRHLYADQWVAGIMSTVPQLLEFEGRWNSSVKALFLHLQHAAIIEVAASTARGDPERVEIVPMFGFHDPLFYYLGVELNRELQNMSFLGSLFAETIANTIILHMLDKYSNLARRRSMSTRKLTPPQIRALDEYLQAHLHERVSLADLASCIHVSVSHFERIFRATLHCPPYHYVLERRIERAKLLLANPTLSLHDVARECGFANQSHFTRHFTRSVGVTPARFVRGLFE
jgi:AraC family transcriptional regulator